jgi:TetR/AcrR family transcriptional regulator
MASNTNNSATRQHILQAALGCFAHSGYSAATVQQIVGKAKVSKPALYYYFPDKAGLFQALVDEAHDERYALMRKAAARTAELGGQLVEILVALFDFLGKNRELMRIAFATAFAAPGEVPDGLRYTKKCERNFEFIHSLIKKGLASGELDTRFDSRELAYGLYGQMNFHVTAHLLMPHRRLDRKVAQRIVELFLAGAGRKQPLTGMN